MMSKIYILDEERTAKIREALEIDYDNHSTEDAATVDAVLALLTPTEVPEDAIEALRAVQEGGYFVDNDQGVETWEYDLSAKEAAALLTAFAKRVPRAMLRDVEADAWIRGATGNLDFVPIDAIADKHGVKVEG